MVVSLASSAYLASAASTLGLVQSAIGLHSIVKRPLYGFDEVLLEALRDSLPRMIALEATEQSLSHRPLSSWTRPRFAGQRLVFLSAPFWTQRAALIQRTCYRVSTLQIVVGGLTLYT